MPFQPPDLNSSPIKDYVYLKSNVAGLFFDCWLKSNHTSRMRITEHPVQQGAAVVDHMYREPYQLQVVIKMSDVATSFIPGQFSGGWSRSVQAYKALRDLQISRIPFQVHSRLGLFQNMVIEEITADDDVSTLFGLNCTVMMREIMVAKVKTVKVSKKPAVTNKSDRGEVQAKPLNGSVLHNAAELAKKVGGGTGR